MLVATAEFCGIIMPPDLTIWNTLVPRFRAAVGKYVTVTNFNDRISDARMRLMLLTRMIAVFETYQSDEGQTILTFDQIASKIPEVERRSLAGEHLCLSVLSSLDDTVGLLTNRYPQSALV